MAWGRPMVVARTIVRIPINDEREELPKKPKLKPASGI